MSSFNSLRSICGIQYSEVDERDRIRRGDASHRCVYILKKSTGVDAGVCYVGITNDFKRRMYHHRKHKRLPDGFVARKITGYIDPEKACEIECFLIERYKNDPSRRCDNRMIGGGIGCGIKDNGWTFSRVKAEAGRYKKKKDFIKQSPCAYNAARRLGVLKEVCEHMSKAGYRLGHSEIRDIAKNYTDLNQFKENEKSAYRSSRRKGIFKEITSHMHRELRPSWSEIELIELAKTYTSISQIRNEESGAYLSILKKGIKDAAFSHMVREKAIWNEKTISEEALKYKSNREFREANESAYRASKRLGIKEMVCCHMLNNESSAASV